MSKGFRIYRGIVGLIFLSLGIGTVIAEGLIKCVVVSLLGISFFPSAYIPFGWERSMNAQIFTPIILSLALLIILECI